MTILDGSEPRAFVVATDELRVQCPDNHRALLKLPQPLDYRGLCAHAKAREAAGEGKVNLVLYPAGRPRTAFTRRYVTDQVLVRLEGDAQAADAARFDGACSASPRTFAPGFLVLEVTGPGEALAAARRWRALPGVTLSEPLLARQREKKMRPNDALYADQWNLRNVGQGGSLRGVDIHVEPVWDTYRGAGVTIAIVDDGVQYTHPDLSPNYDPSLDYDINDQDHDAAPVDMVADSHGTQCAGVIGARGHNTIGVAGVAYESTITGVRLLGADWTDDDEAQAFAYSNSIIQIQSHSWGIPDSGYEVDGPGPLAKAALENGTTNGRGGRGTIYVFAGGNGLGFAEDSNYDGYANSIRTIAVGAVDDAGFQTWYSEPGANLVVCAPSSDGLAQNGIATVDMTGNGGANTNGAAGDYADRDYTRLFGGTSASAPTVAGVVALMLQANPGLGWRDVQEILLTSARRNHSADSDWATNGAGLRFSHKYGPGIVDAEAAVALARGWTNLGPQTTTELIQTNLAVAIPDNSAAGVSRAFAFTAPGFRVEHATVSLDARHNYRGDLQVTLTSPGGMVSRLAEQHFDFNTNYVNWTFSSVRHWGEAASGTWTVKVADRSAGDAGTVTAVRVTLYGSLPSGPQLAAAGATLAVESNLPANAAVDPGEGVTVNLALQNMGNRPTANLTATLLAVGGVNAPSGPQSYGALAAGGAAMSRSFSFTATGACGTTVSALLALQDGPTNLGVACFPLVLGRAQTDVFSNPAGLSISTNEGPASPFPSSIAVGPRTGRVHDVKAEILGLTHTWLSDLSMLLVGPTDLQILLEDSATEGLASGLNLVFSGNAPLFVPYGLSASGTYKPCSYYGGFPSNAPDGEEAYTLGEFNGVPPAGNWRLYVFDWIGGDGGTISQWRLTLTTMECTDNMYFQAPAYGTLENAGTVTVRVTRTGGREGGSSVSYATTNGSAQAGADYTAASGTLTFLPGETEKTIPIPILSDSLTETAETFRVLLSAAGGEATLGAITAAVVTITNASASVIPVEWLIQYGLPTDGSADFVDTDGDAFNNWQEWKSGSVPTNAQSFLRVEETQTAGPPLGYRIRWASATGRLYSVERSADPFDTPVFGILVSNVAGQAGSTTHTDYTATNRVPYLYRILAE